MKSLTVEQKFEEKNLVTYLTNKFPSLKLGSVYKALRKKDIKINGIRINKNVTLHFKDKLDIYISDYELYGVNLQDIKTIYEDNNIIVFYKPINLEVVGDFSLTSIMGKSYSFLEPCHRIDRNTTGLVLYAKNSEDLKAYLFKDSKRSIVYISDEPKKGYSKIFTSYKVISVNREKNLSLLNITLHTGKTHQIRAHLAHVGLPILGDGKYGSYQINKKFGITTQLLCSYSLLFKFSDNNDILSYLNGKEIKLTQIPFFEFL